MSLNKKFAKKKLAKVCVRPHIMAWKLSSLVCFIGGKLE